MSAEQTGTAWEGYPGALGFKAELRKLKDGEAHGPPLFRWDEPLYVGRAPGRMDVMGGIADYSGALVLQMPISDACFVALQLNNDQQDTHIRIVSASHAAAYEVPTSTLFCHEGGPLPYAQACQIFKAAPSTSWAAYVAGCLLVLAHEKGITQLSACSVSVFVSSQVPEGKGVSSSAALEVATMMALVGALGLGREHVSAWELAVLCQKVENLVVGAPCGIMDQMACMLGQEGRLLALLCQPAEVQGMVAIPPHLRVWGVDSGVRHSVGGSDYGSVRAAAFMGLSIARCALASAGGVEQSWRGRSTATGEGAGGSGGSTAVLAHLVQLAPSELEGWLRAALPAQLKGSEFLRVYGPHVDPVTVVNPEQEYAVQVAAAHPVLEHSRVRLFRQLLAASKGLEQCLLLGELMFQSHESYNSCRLGSPGTDRLVQLVRQHLFEAQAASRGPLLYGAKITGGGCGGTVCILGEATPEADEAVAQLARAYWAEQGYPGEPKVFSGSSAGAASFGHAIIPSL